MRKVLTSILLLFSFAISAQHKHGGEPSKHEEMETPMSHGYSLNLPMNRNGSGTSWLPDSSVMYGHGIMTRHWMFMSHSNKFLRYNWQDVTNKSNRGGQQFDSPNMFMFMGQRRIGEAGLFHFSTMFSLEPFTIGASGYPLLFQTGEQFNGKPLVDRQHPHDLFGELSVAYTHSFTKDVDLTGYFGFPGEPATGPVVYLHRLSALNNPDAPLSHHWQDATHVTFGVATIGLRVGRMKVEGSLFTGREPDDNRYNFDRPRFDSYSLRVLFNPNSYFALEASQALIVSPEKLHPDENIARSTASVIHHFPLGAPNKYVASTAVWGFNNSDRTKQHSILMESNVQLDRLAIYGRYEWVQKSAEELDLTEFPRPRLFNIQAITVGTNYVLFRRKGNNTALGIQGSLFAAPDLKSIYGDKPVSVEVYIRMYPHIMHMHHRMR